MVKKRESERAVQQFNGRAGNNSDFVIEGFWFIWSCELAVSPRVNSAVSRLAVNLQLIFFCGKNCDVPKYQYTAYFENEVLRKRSYLKKEWCEFVVENPIRVEA